jgi:hypothetical protein
MIKMRALKRNRTPLGRAESCIMHVAASVHPVSRITYPHPVSLLSLLLSFLSFLHNVAGGKKDLL